MLDEKGPDHAKAFEIGVFCNGRRYPSAWGSNKKQAEQLAARAALLEVGAVDPEKEEDARG
jgi:ribonuclease-3